MGYFGQRGRDFGTLNRGMGLGLYEDLGAFAPLSVKFYPAANGWASYQSPAANVTLTGINAALAALGFPSTYDGIIRKWSADAVKSVAFWAQQPVVADWKIPTGSGGSVGYAGSILSHLTDMESLAKGGTEALYYLQGLAAQTSFRPYMASKAAATGIKPVVPAPTPTTPSPTPTAPAPIAPAPSNDLVATLKSPIGIAAIGIGVALIYVSTRSGGRRRRARR